MSLFEELEQNCKVIYDGDDYGYLKADDIKEFLENSEADDFECTRDTLPKEMLK